MTTILITSGIIYLLSLLIVGLFVIKEEGPNLKFWNYFVIFCPAVNTITALLILLGGGDGDVDLPDFDFD